MTADTYQEAFWKALKRIEEFHQPPRKGWPCSRRIQVQADSRPYCMHGRHICDALPRAAWILVGLMRQTGQFRDIVEMQPLPFRDPWSWLVLLLALGAAFFLGWRRDVRPFSLLSLLAGAFLAFRGRRDVWFLVVTAISIIATVRSTAGPVSHFPLTKRRLVIIVGALVVLAVVIGWRQDISKNHLDSVVASHFPVGAASFVEKEGCQGPLYNNYDWGGYLI